MRISDWSSDVCSSDLRIVPAPPVVDPARQHRREGERGERADDKKHVVIGEDRRLARRFAHHLRPGAGAAQRGIEDRSEEHTSELQSLMRISYAVFCLKKKTKTIETSKRMTRGR